MKQGYETGLFGSRLAKAISESAAHTGWRVYYDHGDTNIDSNVASIKGFFGEEVANLNRLADVDVLIGAPSGEAIVVIEIEERFSSPKQVLGNVLAALMCNHKGQGR